ncbi:hypothetical protein Fcan01_11747 [Folsomia candida]|uniref:Uncharacterized protein n=1 Tax=Folsomia candida TaxID=158441 RepID=A0A226E7S4_FOLCA|nr:hypothetical protein Fcan01_11747 [Folsomia candida]
MKEKREKGESKRLRMKEKEREREVEYRARVVIKRGRGVYRKQAEQARKLNKKVEISTWKVQGDDVYFQPSLVTELKYGIKLHPGIMDKKHLFVSIWNLSPRILTLFSGTVLGLGRPCKEAIESKLMSIAGMGTSDGKIPKTKEPFDAKYFDINPDAEELKKN